MYHLKKDAVIENSRLPAQSNFRLIETVELNKAVEFGVNAIGADAGWLEGYYMELIARGELYGLWQDSDLIAAGELRLSASQKNIADVGVVVSQNHRVQGLATNVLRQLIHSARKLGLNAICSTESDNIAAQKAITKSGFTSYHQILDISFHS